MKQLAQSLGLLGIESPVNGMRMLRARLKRFREPLLVMKAWMALRAVWGLQPNS